DEIQNQINGWALDPVPEIARAKAKVKQAVQQFFQLGLVADPKREAEKVYNLYKALFNLAKIYVRKGVKTVAEFAQGLGLEVNLLLERAWNDASSGTMAQSAADLDLQIVTEVMDQAKERKFSMRLNADTRIAEPIRNAVGNATYQPVPNA